MEFGSMDDTKGQADTSAYSDLSSRSPRGAIPFPRWVPTEIRQAAMNLSKEEACLQLGDWNTLYLRSDIE
jgi:hypothetical protein